MARELDEDPEQLILLCMEALCYSRAKAGLESKDEATRNAWKEDPLMEDYVRNEYDLRHQARIHRTPVDGCKPCDRLRA